MTTTESKHWAIYTRVSTRHQVDGFSLADQEQKLTSFATQQDWDWVVYTDPGFSGEHLAGRPGITAILEAAEAGRLEGVLCLDESRLARDEYVAAAIRHQLMKAGVRLATLGRGVLDLTDPSQKFTASVLAAAHDLEQGIRTQKMKAGLRRTVEAGFWPGGPAPYGYRLVPSLDGHHTVVEKDEEQAAVLRRAYDLIVNHGFTTVSTAAYLNAHGYLTTRGQIWRHPNLCFRLRQDHTTGVWTYRQGSDPVEMRIPAIFTIEEWERLQASIKGRPRPQRRNRLYPLTGRGPRRHLRCSCGGNYFGKVDTGKKGRAYYQCSRDLKSFGPDRCPLVPKITQAERLEQAVWRSLIDALSNGDYLAGLAADYLSPSGDEMQYQGIGNVERRLTKLAREETNIVRSIARRGLLTAEVLGPALAEVRSEKDAVVKELARIRALQKQACVADGIEDEVRRLAACARDLLADATLEVMAEVLDILQLDLIRVGGLEYEGIARLPLPSSDTGEVSKEGPLLLVPRRPRCDQAALPG